MRFIKLAVISFVVIAGMMMIISAMIPSNVNILRTVNLSVSKDSTIRRISNLNDWASWNLYVSNPALTDLVITDNLIQSNELSIRKLSFQNDTLLTSWSQKGGKTFNGGLVFYGDENLTIVQWYFTIPVKWYPWEKFGSLIYEKQIGPVMEESLNRLGANAIR